MERQIGYEKAANAGAVAAVMSQHISVQPATFYHWGWGEREGLQTVYRTHL